MEKNYSYTVTTVEASVFVDAYDKQIYEHYVSFFGEPTNIYRYSQPFALINPPLYVLEYASTPEDPRCTYLTIGASRKAQDNLFELLMYSDRQNVEVANSLIKLAGYAKANNTFFSYEHTIDSIIDGIVPNSNMTAALFLRPFVENEDFHYIHLENGKHVLFLWVLPVYSSERLFFKQHGFVPIFDLLSQYYDGGLNLFREPLSQSLL